MRILISFGSRQYERAMDALAESATSYFDTIITYGEESITDQKDTHPELFADGRGYGYWMWKPYLIAKTLEDYHDQNPVVMYCDSTMTFVRSPAQYLDLAYKHGAVFFKQKHLQKSYTKGDCFHLMEATEPEHKEFNHLNAAFNIWTSQSHHLAIQWWDWCKKYDVVSDKQTNLHPNDPSFVAHRHDQSILSVLLSKYNKFCEYPIVDDISQFGPGEPILNHHRGL